MSLVRPEVVQALARWREAMLGALLLALGLRLVFNGVGIFPWIGGIVSLAGVGLVAAGIQRGRFRGPGGGAGVVDVDERQITYFGPVTGGTMALDDILRIETCPPRLWRLTSDAGTVLTIPFDAHGNEALFDAFSALPGLRSGAVADAVSRSPKNRTLIWERPQVRLG